MRGNHRLPGRSRHSPPRRLSQGRRPDGAGAAGREVRREGGQPHRRSLPARPVRDTGRFVPFPPPLGALTPRPSPPFPPDRDRFAPSPAEPNRTEPNRAAAGKATHTHHPSITPEKCAGRRERRLVPRAGRGGAGLRPGAGRRGAGGAAGGAVPARRQEGGGGGGCLGGGGPGGGGGGRGDSPPCRCRRSPPAALRQLGREPAVWRGAALSREFCVMRGGCGGWGGGSWSCGDLPRCRRCRSLLRLGGTPAARSAAGRSPPPAALPLPRATRAAAPALRRAGRAARGAAPPRGYLREGCRPRRGGNCPAGGWKGGRGLRLSGCRVRLFPRRAADCGAEGAGGGWGGGNRSRGSPVLPCPGGPQSSAA